VPCGTADRETAHRFGLRDGGRFGRGFDLRRFDFGMMVRRGSARDGLPELQLVRFHSALGHGLLHIFRQERIGALDWHQDNHASGVAQTPCRAPGSVAGAEENIRPLRAFDR